MRNSVLFSKDGTSVELPAPARFARTDLRLHQASGRTAGGELFVYELGGTVCRAELEFRLLTESQRDALAHFFEDVAEGMRKTWRYIHTDGREYTARFAEPALSFVQFAANVWDVRLRLELDSLLD